MAFGCLRSGLLPARTSTRNFPWTRTHNLGFPRIGARRELKFALESYWKGQSSRDALKTLGGQPAPAPLGSTRRASTWVPVGDFAFYDQVLDMSFTLGNLPERVRGFHWRRAGQLLPCGARPLGPGRRRPWRAAAAAWPRAR